MDVSAVTTGGVQAGERILQGIGSSVGNNSGNKVFSKILSSALDLINETDGLAEKAERMEMDLTLGKIKNVHDVTIAQSKALMSLQYTVAIKNSLLDAYKEIMNIQI